LYERDWGRVKIGYDGSLIIFLSSWSLQLLKVGRRGKKQTIIVQELSVELWADAMW
jgi:hypothetical protein